MDNRIYKAPSIPKINRTTIASPFTRGGVSSSGIRLKRSSFSFIRPIKRQIDPENLAQPAAEQTNFIGKELAETNRVLVEIQKQLSLDFGYRIAEEKKAIALEKKRISARRTSDKESRLEKGPKGVLGRTFDAVTAPFKSIFQKLIDFFSIILTGILLNTAFEWLGKKENQAKVKAFFDFVTEYWKELLIIFAAYKLLKLVKAIAGVAITLRRMLKWFKGFRSPQPKPSGTQTSTRPTSTRPTTTTQQQRSPLLNSQGNPISGPIKPSGSLVTPSGSPLRQAYPLSGQQSFTAPSIPKSPPPKLNKITNLPPGLGGSSGGRGSGAFTIASYLYGLAVGPEVMKQRVSFLEGLKKTNPQEYKREIEKLKENAQLEAALSYFGSPTESIPILKALGEKYKTFITPLGGMSSGGTVGQGDRAGTDTVPAQTGFGKMFLDAGEEVIKTSSAMFFRPLLKDINENAGRMWQQFTQAVIKLMDITGIQKDNAEIFKQVLENYNKFLKDQIQKMKLKEFENVGGGMGGGDGRMSSGPSPSPSAPMSAPTSPNISLNLNKQGDKPQVNLSPTVINASISAPQSSAKLTPVTPIVNNFILDSSSNNKSTFTEINLPPQVVNNTPKVPTYSAKSNEVPNIIPFDFLNPWMSKESISERYGVAYGI